MRRPLRSLLLVPLLTLALGAGDSPAAAQEEGARRAGLWLSGGLGGGWNVSDGLDDERLGGISVFLRVGGTPSRHLRLGGELMDWSDDLDTEGLERSSALVSLAYYPWATGGFFVRGGLGIAAVEVERTIPLRGLSGRGTGTLRLVEEPIGFGSDLGVGYDIPLGGRLHLSPNVDWYFQAFDAPPDLTGTNHLLLFTLGATLY